MAVAIDQNKCVGCGECVQQCPLDALKIEDAKAAVDEGTCAECGACIDACPEKAIAL
ncbi:MAG: 4Fe-4S binding protein [Planctomycetaceae bacterium]|jgi:NAD-dependent dihydropyrimidine dehydrogenase PreA subunit|nr:4Fe-4S binding protein [Planctomycetaceae bacterium]